MPSYPIPIQTATLAGVSSLLNNRSTVFSSKNVKGKICAAQTLVIGFFKRFWPFPFVDFTLRLLLLMINTQIDSLYNCRCSMYVIKVKLVILLKLTI